MPALASLATPGALEATQEARIPLPGLAQVGKNERAQVILDARPPSHFTQREEDEALEKIAIDAGPATAGIVRRVADSFDAIRAELNEVAGGQASDRVMTLAHNAQRAQLAVELQTTVSVSAHGRYVANGGDKGQTEKGLSKLVGICAFATDLLNKAYEAARSEAGSRQSPTAQLMSRLGVGQPAPEVPAPSPLGPPGGATFKVPSLDLQELHPVPPSPENSE